MNVLKHALTFQVYANYITFWELCLLKGGGFTQSWYFWQHYKMETSVFPFTEL